MQASTRARAARGTCGSSVTTAGCSARPNGRDLSDEPGEHRQRQQDVCGQAPLARARSQKVGSCVMREPPVSDGRARRRDEHAGTPDSSAAASPWRKSDFASDLRLDGVARDAVTRSTSVTAGAPVERVDQMVLLAPPRSQRRRSRPDVARPPRSRLERQVLVDPTPSCPGRRGSRCRRPRSRGSRRRSRASPRRARRRSPCRCRRGRAGRRRSSSIRSPSSATPPPCRRGTAAAVGELRERPVVARGDECVVHGRVEEAARALARVECERDDAARSGPATSEPSRLSRDSSSRPGTARAAPRGGGTRPRRRRARAPRRRRRRAELDLRAHRVKGAAAS